MPNIRQLRSPQPYINLLACTVAHLVITGCVQPYLGLLNKIEQPAFRCVLVTIYGLLLVPLIHFGLASVSPGTSSLCRIARVLVDLYQFSRWVKWKLCSDLISVKHTANKRVRAQCRQILALELADWDSRLQQLRRDKAALQVAVDELQHDNEQAEAAHTALEHKMVKLSDKMQAWRVAGSRRAKKQSRKLVNCRIEHRKTAVKLQSEERQSAAMAEKAINWEGRAREYEAVAKDWKRRSDEQAAMAKAWEARTRKQEKRAKIWKQHADELAVKNNDWERRAGEEEAGKVIAEQRAAQLGSELAASQGALAGILNQFNDVFWQGRRKIMDLEGHNSTLEVQNNVLQTRLDTLGRENSYNKGCVQLAEARLAQSHSELDTANDTIARLQANSARLECDLVESQQLSRVFLGYLGNTISQERRAVKNLGDQNCQLVNERDGLQASLEVLWNDSNGNKERADRLGSEKHGLEAEFAHVHDDLQIAIQTIARLKDENGAIKEERDNFKTRLDTANLEKTDEKRRGDELASSRDALDALLVNTRQELEAAQETVGLVAEERDVLEKKHDAVQAMSFVLEVERNADRERASRLQSDKDALEVGLHSSRGKLEAAMVKIAQLSDERAGLEKDRDIIRARLSVEEIEIVTERQRARKLEADKDTLQAEIHQTRGELDVANSKTCQALTERAYVERERDAIQAKLFVEETQRLAEKARAQKLETDKEAVEIEMRDVRNELEVVKGKVSRLLGDHAALEKECDVLQVRLSEEEIEKVTQRERADNLEVDKEASDRVAREAQDRFVVFCGKLEISNQTVDELESRNSALQQDLDDAHAELAVVKRESADNKQLVDSTKAKLMRAIVQLQDADATVSRLIEEHGELQQLADVLRSARNDAQRCVLDLKAQLAQCGESERQAQALIRDVQGKAEEMEKDAEALHEQVRILAGRLACVQSDMATVDGKLRDEKEAHWGLKAFIDEAFSAMDGNTGLHGKQLSMLLHREKVAKLFFEYRAMRDAVWALQGSLEFAHLEGLARDGALYPAEDGGGTYRLESKSSSWIHRKHSL